MTDEQELLDYLVDTMDEQRRTISKKNVIITFLAIMLIVVSGLGISLKNHYEPQINGLRAQLSRTQKQLKRASEDRARQTKRIAELTGNGG
ncbi:phage membrane protein [Streptococcus dysgalactiae subsp. dysgalactiae ATCC 27957]|nr:phage membrane protein [Streptococcus dysgalactiae subsp. dysgalactiae ATCC 27957]